MATRRIKRLTIVATGLFMLFNRWRFCGLGFLEINRQHPLIQNLAHLVTAQPDNAVVDATIEQLFENLLLLEGLHPNPAQMVPRIQTLLEAATKVEE